MPRPRTGIRRAYPPGFGCLEALWSDRTRTRCCPNRSSQAHRSRSDEPERPALVLPVGGNAGVLHQPRCRQVRRLAASEDGLDDARRQPGETNQPRRIGLRNALLRRDRRPAWRGARHQRLVQRPGLGDQANQRWIRPIGGHGRSHQKRHLPTDPTEGHRPGERDAREPSIIAIAMLIATSVAVLDGSALARAREDCEQSLRREMDDDLLPLHRHLSAEGQQDLAPCGVALLVPTTRQLPCGLEHPLLPRCLRRQRPNGS